jgi:hypothetical protein
MLFSRKRGDAIILSDKDGAGHYEINGGVDCTIANIALEGYIGYDRQRAWINPLGTMQGLNLLHCDIAGVFYRAVTIATGMRVYDCTFSDIGVLGMGYANVPNSNVSLDHCEFKDIKGENAGDLVEYGALKWGNVSNSEVVNCKIQRCIEGVWFDGEPLANSAGNTDYENYGNRIIGNIITDIEKSGIHHELSHSALILKNFVQNCGSANSKWAWGAGILVIDASNSIIRANFVDCRNGANGISIGKQDRKPFAYHNLVDSNYIVYGEKSHSGIYDADNEKLGFFAGHQYYAGGNAYTRNIHYVLMLGANRYGIDHKHTNLNGWQSRQQDAGGKEQLYIDGDPLVPDLEWSLNNDFDAPLPVPPIIVQPPDNGRPSIPVGTKFKFNGEIEVIEG